MNKEGKIIITFKQDVTGDLEAFIEAFIEAYSKADIIGIEFKPDKPMIPEVIKLNNE